MTNFFDVFRKKEQEVFISKDYFLSRVDCKNETEANRVMSFYKRIGFDVFKYPKKKRGTK